MPGVSCRELLQCRQQRTQRGPIRLVHPIIERRSQQIAPALHESRQQQHGVLHIGHRVRP